MSNFAKSKNKFLQMKDLKNIVAQFATQGTVAEVKPLGSGLINDTYIVRTNETDAPDYVMQRVNHHIFTNVEGLQNNIEAVTAHIRAKLEAEGADDIDRKVLHFVPLAGEGEQKTYYYDAEEDSYWRLMTYIPDSYTLERVTPESARSAGVAFGRFQSMLVDIKEELIEVIPDFHNIEFRLRQLREAVANDAAGRVEGVRDLIAETESFAEEMSLSERLYREGVLPKRICHCDTKVNNMLVDDKGEILCVIDLDTVMPSFIFSDFGDFLRTAANNGDEDDRDLDRVSFNMEIFTAFTEGYLASAGSFLTPVEIENLPYAAMLFPYMQVVRFLADYLNGDTYFKTQYPEHNLVRTLAQMKLFKSVKEHVPAMREVIARLTAAQ